MFASSSVAIAVVAWTPAQRGHASEEVSFNSPIELPLPEGTLTPAPMSTTGNSPPGSGPSKLAVSTDSYACRCVLLVMAFAFELWRYRLARQLIEDNGSWRHPRSAGARNSRVHRHAFVDVDAMMGNGFRTAVIDVTRWVDRPLQRAVYRAG